MGGKHLFILPPDGGLCGKALGNIQKPLVGAAPEAQGDIVLGFHKAAVHQNIQQTQQLICDLTAGRAGNTAGQLFPGVTGIAPDALIRVQRPEVADKGQQLSLVLRLKRLTAQQGDACNIVGLAGCKDLVAHSFVEGLTVPEIPCHLVEAARAVVPAARNKDAGAHPRPIGNVVILDCCVIHR